ncbi:TonB-dependent hemoglobin/transferrin/lactoferrin family receptor [Vibrio navarrensis]|uniref:TonB-dependent receptor n=1 Tax=Vibrio navarrensis TaxID=29495 RepID=A0A099LW68_9VIBR|nr:TonB-dependent hemoglobin/transferrin/lactoferrin family receptor [Vibrio navarrensis]KGK11894.1 TonB-dependent receptor [Vibrio navarrensis]MBE4616065.1 TonB-dependent receptor [Vibrio navarrensis]QOD67604.1 TonB-dependent hemoglobin/transferrin/lactoferrin family receptor [Vibrio navarrensis]
MYNKTFLSASILLALSASVQAEEYGLFDEIVVSATRTNQTIDSVAASVAVVTEEQLEENMTKNVSDVFEYVPGVTVNSSQRQGVQNINIRGMEGKRVKIIVDGASQPGVFSGGPYEFINSSAVTVEPDMLKSVEVVKGAASSLHGSDAIGGVVAFETKDPKDFLKDGKDRGGQVKVTYSSEDNSFSEHVAVAKRFESLEALVAYTRRDGEELDNFAKAPYTDYAVESQNYANNDLLIKLQSQLSDAHRIEFTGEVIYNQIDSDIANKSYQNFNSEDSTKQNRIALKHIWFADSSVADTVTSRLTWLSKKENGVTNRFKAASAGVPPWVPPNNDNQQKKDYNYTEDKLEFESQLDKELGKHYFVYGLSAKQSDISNINREYNSDPSTDDQIYVYTPDAKEQSIGLFFQDEISLLSEKLIVTPGIRYDYFLTDPSNTSVESFEKFSDSAITGRVGATYRLTAPGTIFAQISQGFRAPAFDELYYTYDNPAHGYVNKPNPNLGSEKSLSYELGYRHNTTSSASEIALYYSDYKDFIEQTSSNVDGLTEYTNINIDEAQIKGIEVSNMLDWHQIAGLPAGISTKVIAAYTKGEDGKGNPLNSVNPWNAVAAFNYDSPTSGWGTSLKVNYTASKSQRDINSNSAEGGISGQVSIPSATVVDLTAYFKPMNDLTLRAGVMNLTNEEYYSWNDIRGKKSLTKDYTQAERNFSLSVKYEF